MRSREKINPLHSRGRGHTEWDGMKEEYVRPEKVWSKKMRTRLRFTDMEKHVHLADR